MIIVRIWEGLGNQLFQYAYARAMKERGIDVRVDLSKSFDESFEKYKYNDLRHNVIQKYHITIPEASDIDIRKYEYINRNNAKQRILFKLSQARLLKYKFYEEITQGYSSRTDNLSGNYYVKGWFQSEKYFKNIRKELLKEITLIDDSHIRNTRFPEENSVSVHVRRGDYVKTHHCLNMAYYRGAIELIRQHIKYPVFYIFSDDIAWVRKHLSIQGDIVWMNCDGYLKDYEELILMSKCSHNIISNSTFSWWGGWLNTFTNKIVVAPRIWLQGQKGIVPTGWVVY